MVYPYFAHANGTQIEMIKLFIEVVASSLVINDLVGTELAYLFFSLLGLSLFLGR